MKKKFIKALALGMSISMALIGCGNSAEETQNNVDSTEAENEETEAEATVLDNGYPWINSCLKENVTEDTETNPKDDLYLYANKDWILENEIPEGDSSYSLYAARAKDVEDETIELLQDDTLTSDDAKITQSLYNAALDWDARNELGVTPLESTTNKLLSANSLDEITKLSTDADSELADLFSYYSYGGISDSSKNYLYLDTVGLLLSDAANYEENSEYGQMLYGYYEDTYVYLANRLGIEESDATSQFENCIALETLLAKNIMTDEEMMASDYYDKVNNVMSMDDALSLCVNYPLETLLKTEGVEYGGSVIVTSPDYFTSLDEIYTEENFELIRDYMLVNFVVGGAKYLDREAYESLNEIYGDYFGVEGISEDEDYGYNVVCANLPTQISRLYIENFSSEEDKEKIEEVCYDVIDTYSKMLEENTWASQETIDYAVEKLNAITVNVGWPDVWPDYTGLDIEGLGYYDAINTIANFEAERELSTLGQEVDADNWADGMSLLDCNAYYDPSDNSINMILGMMGEPFYYSDMPVEELYASVGAFWVGHEVSHAFDSNGAQYDIDGNLNSWWSDEDWAEFESRVEKMDDYLDSILVMGDYYMTGSNVDSEMIADMTGMQCVLKMAEDIDGFDYQKFFEYYARMNVSIDSYSTILYSIQSDEHPIDYQRANVPAQQFEEFYEAYGVEEGDGMYLADADRVLIW